MFNDTVYEMETENGKLVTFEATLLSEGIFSWETGYGAESGLIEILEDPDLSFQVFDQDGDPQSYQDLGLTEGDVEHMKAVATAYYWDRIDV